MHRAIKFGDKGSGIHVARTPGKIGVTEIELAPRLFGFKWGGGSGGGKDNFHKCFISFGAWGSHLVFIGFFPLVWGVGEGVALEFSQPENGKRESGRDRRTASAPGSQDSVPVEKDLGKEKDSHGAGSLWISEPYFRSAFWTDPLIFMSLRFAHFHILTCPTHLDSFLRIFPPVSRISRVHWISPTNSCTRFLRSTCPRAASSSSAGFPNMPCTSGQCLVPAQG